MTNTVPEIKPEHMLRLQDITHRVGRINGSWNDVQFFIYTIFTTLLHPNYSLAEAIFFALRSDKSQRDITLAAAEERLSSFPEPLAKLREQFVVINKLSGRRNDAIHGMFGLKEDLTPGPLGGSSPRLRSKNLEDELNQIHSSILDAAMAMTEMVATIRALPLPSLEIRPGLSLEPGSSPPADNPVLPPATPDHPPQS